MIIPVSAPKKDNGVLIFFGILSAFALFRVCYALDLGGNGWMLVLLPGFWLPLYYYGGAFLVGVRDKDKTPEEIEAARKGFFWFFNG